jgi:hypothetical protein
MTSFNTRLTIILSSWHIVFWWANHAIWWVNSFCTIFTGNANIIYLTFWTIWWAHLNYNIYYEHKYRRCSKSTLFHNYNNQDLYEPDGNNYRNCLNLNMTHIQHDSLRNRFICPLYKSNLYILLLRVAVKLRLLYNWNIYVSSQELSKSNHIHIYNLINLYLHSDSKVLLPCLCYQVQSY